MVQEHFKFISKTNNNFSNSLDYGCCVGDLLKFLIMSLAAFGIQVCLFYYSYLLLPASFSLL